MKTFLEMMVIALIFLIAVVVIGVLIAFPIKWMWNYLMPELFGLKEIGFWQALAMFVLCSCLFKNYSSSSK